MKIRTGFVSNSSSSSFICVICGNVESGMEMSYEDAEYYNCQKGHTICESHLGVFSPEMYKNFLLKEYKLRLDQEYDTLEEYNDNVKNLEEMDPDNYPYLSESEYEFRSEMPPEFCPVCQFEESDKDNLLKYVLLTKNLNKKDLLSEIKEKFKTYEKFEEFLKGS